MACTSDLGAYFERIGFSGSSGATLKTLRDLHRLHPEHIPFENLDPLLGVSVPIDLPSLHDKLVARRRGGYCFEQNLLLHDVLETIGFRVTGLAARVQWNVPKGVTLPKTHMLLCVEIGQERWIADVGFGGQVLTAPLQLIPNQIQATPHEPFRITEDGDGYLLETRIHNDWVAIYQFDLRAQLLPDYEMSNWYVSTHPSSRFTTSLTVARTEPGRRYALHNDRFAIHDSSTGTTTQQVVNSVDEMKVLLRECFQISLPAHQDLDACLMRFMG